MCLGEEEKKELETMHPPQSTKYNVPVSAKRNSLETNTSLCVLLTYGAIESLIPLPSISTVFC